MSGNWAVQDLVPSGMALGKKVELTQDEGSVQIAYSARLVTVMIQEGKRTFTVQVAERR